MNVINITDVETLEKEGSLPEVAFVRGDLCFVREVPKSRDFPLSVKFAFRPPNSIEWSDIRARLQDIQAIEDKEKRRKEDNALGLQLLIDHLKLWDLKRGAGPVPLTEAEFNTTPSAITGFILGCILNSAIAVEDTEKKLPGSSVSPSATAAGLN